MRQSVAAGGFIAAILLGAVGLRESSAGAKQVLPVTINFTTRTAAGALGSARNSADVQQYIGCQTNTWGTNDIMGGCFAATSTGASASCYFYGNEGLWSIIQSITSDSYVSFRWNTSNVCESIHVGTHSYLEPKK